MSNQKKPSATTKVISLDPTQKGLSVPQCALYVGLSHWQVRMAIWQGKLSARRVGKSLLILRSDADKFLEMLSQPNARLMVIGYGFGDDHINRIIYEAWGKGGKTLSMFVVQPDGRESLKKINRTNRPGRCVGRMP